LLRFCDLAAGSAILCGHDLAGFDPDDVRAVIGGCPQDPHIFAGTIAANLRIAKPAATGEEIAEAAEQACLLPWIRSLPLGFDTPVGARGGGISGGERQRMALARALLADPPVLILDEPTASLEPHVAKTTMANLLAVTADRATLLITHDLGVLDQMDEIVVLERGRVAERGRHDELIRSGGSFQEMDRCHRAHGQLAVRLLLRLTALPRSVDLEAQPVLVWNGQIGPEQFHRLPLEGMYDSIQVGVRAQHDHRRRARPQVVLDGIDHRAVDGGVL
jgi:ABC-type transport system involved in cytochrome bd biosynthesis fused ATPase/permease subunit